MHMYLELSTLDWMSNQGLMPWKVWSISQQSLLAYSSSSSGGIKWELPIHIGSSTCAVIIKVVFKGQCYSDFMGAVYLSYVEILPCSRCSDFSNLSTSACYVS